ncbi:MAG TPA: phosphotransferase [Fibrobacteria bacterium]|nr:phosphotransferase [Fibrobacteria bacterium]
MEPPDGSLPEPLRIALENRLLPAWLPARRWWRAKSRTLVSVAIEAAIPIRADTIFLIVRAAFKQGESERYAVPILLALQGRKFEFPETAVIGAAPDGRLIADACHDPAFRAALLDLLAGKTEAEGFGGILRGHPDRSRDFAGLAGDQQAKASRLYAGEQSNTSFSFDEKVSVKLYRRFEGGIHPEPEMLRALRRAGYHGAPLFLSTLEWVPKSGLGVTLALAQEFLRDAKDAWAFAVDALTNSLREERLPDALTRWAATLGARVGELHAALASRPDDPDFAPEPLTDSDLAAARAGSLSRLAAGAEVLGSETTARLREKLQVAAPAGAKIRVHGDLHLGQVLLAEGGPRLLDFEGEPGRPLAEARRKASPLRDAAGMLRSFHYAAHSAARAEGNADAGGRAEAFADMLGATFRQAYFRAVESARLFPPQAGDDAEVLALLNFFILEKALYELEYERNNRPDWVAIPLGGLKALAL